MRDPDSDSHSSEIAEIALLLGLLVRRARALQRADASSIHPDLNPTGYAILLAISDSNDITATGIGSRLDLDKSAVSRQLRWLREAGLTSERPDPLDGRSNLVSLTQAGTAAVGRTKQSNREALRDHLSRWNTAQLHDFAQHLHRLLDDSARSVERAHEAIPL